MKKIRFQVPFISLFFIFLYIPIIVMIILSLSKSSSLSHISLTFNGYRDLFKNRSLFQTWFFSIVIALISSLISVVLAVPTCILISKVYKKTKFVVFGVFSIPIILPDIFVAIFFLLVFSFFQIKLGLFTIIFVNVFMSFPYVVIIIYRKISSLLKLYYEPSRNLGANFLQIITKIIIPLSYPVLIIAFLFGFVLNFDDFIINFFNSGKYSNIAIYIYTTSKINTSFFSLGTIIFLVFLIFGIFSMNFIIYKNKKRNSNKNHILLFLRLDNSKIVNLLLKRKKIIFICAISLICIVLFLVYIIQYSLNSVNAFLFNGYLSSNSLSWFNKEQKINIYPSYYETNEEFKAKAKYTKFDLAMMSAYLSVNYYNKDKYSQSKYKLRSAEFISDINKMNGNNIPPIKNISSLYNSQMLNIFNKFNNSNNLLMYMFPYSCSKLCMILKYPNSSGTTNSYEQIYYDSLNNKKVILYDDSHNMIYLGIKIFQAFHPTEVDKNSDNNVLFTKNNILHSYNYLAKMITHKNTILCDDIAPTWFINKSFDDMFVNDYNIALWLKNYFKQTNNAYDMSKYYMPDNINGSAVWFDGFVVNLTEKNISKQIKFIASQFTSKIELNNSLYYTFLVPTVMIYNKLINNNNFSIKWGNKTNNIFKFPKNINKYDIFSNLNDNYVVEKYDQLILK